MRNLKVKITIDPGPNKTYTRPVKKEGKGPNDLQ